MASDYDTHTNNVIDGILPGKTHMSPSPDDWKNWRQKGGAPMSAAVLLSMNIHPSQKNREALPAVDFARDKEFKRRYGVAKHQYGLHCDLPVIEHVNFSGRDAQFVKFDGFLVFAKEMGWDNMEEFESNLFPNAEPPKNQTSIRHSVEDVPKGEKYDQIRMGALLELLEKIARETYDPRSLIRGKDFNLSAVGREVEEIVKSRATTSGYSREANRKRFDQAKKALGRLD